MSLDRFGKIVDGINFLSIDDLIFINKTLIEAQTPNEPIYVRDQNLLASSQPRPNMYRYYNQTEDIFVLSSVLIESIIKNHPFANANKRTGMYSGYIFLLLNGWELCVSENGFIKIGEGIATGLYNLEDLENWLCEWSSKYDARNLCHDNKIDVKEFLIKIYQYK